MGIMPSGKTIIRAVILTSLSLVLFAGIASAIPQVKQVPVIGAIFR